MATLSRGTDLTGNDSQITQSRTYTFSTAGKYVDKNIVETVTIPSITLDSGSGVSTSGVSTASNPFTVNAANNTKFVVSFTDIAEVPGFTFSTDASGNIIVS